MPSPLLWVTLTLLCLGIYGAGHGQGETCSSLVSFNAGLVYLIPNVQARAGYVANALRNLDADVFCGQEFWSETILKAILQHAPQFQYHYSQLHHRVNRLEVPTYRWMLSPKEFIPCSSCEKQYLDSQLIPCARENGCLNVQDVRLISGCIVSRCRSILAPDTLSEKCISCAVDVLQSTRDVNFTSCRQINYQERYNPSGLFLLSQKPIHSASYVSYFPDNRMSIQRGYLKAEIEDVGTVVCTHLSSLYPVYLEYDLPFDNYEQQQRREIDIVYQSFLGQDYIWLGDFNTGPDRPNADPQKNLTGENPQHYALLMSYGYVNRYFDLDGRCTYCTDNELVNGAFPSQGIDHILTMGHRHRVIDTLRILDTPPTMSDHYGVQAQMCYTRH